MPAAISELLRGKSRWDRKVRVLVGKRKPGRHNTNNGRLLAIEKYRLADDVSVSTESAQPQPVAEKHDVFRSRCILLGQENSTQPRLDAQNRKQIVRRALS